MHHFLIITIITTLILNKLLCNKLSIHNSHTKVKIINYISFFKMLSTLNFQHSKTQLFLISICISFTQPHMKYLQSHRNKTFKAAKTETKYSHYTHGNNRHCLFIFIQPKKKNQSTESTGTSCLIHKYWLFVYNINCSTTRHFKY